MTIVEIIESVRVAFATSTAYRVGEAELKARPKGDDQKATLALRLRRETPMTRQWIADRLHIGSASYVSHLMTKGKDCRLLGPLYYQFSGIPELVEKTLGARPCRRRVTRK